MSLQLWDLFCTPAVMHTTYFDYVLKATLWKVKVAYMFAMLIKWRKIQKKKLLQITIPLRKWIQLKVYSHSVKKAWISSLTLILIFCWIELAILRSHIKVSQNFIFNFVFYQTLIAFFHAEKSILSRVLIEILYSDRFTYYTSLTFWGLW